MALFCFRLPRYGFAFQAAWDRIQAYNLLKHSTVTVWYVCCYHTGESRCVSVSLGVRADHMAFARVDSVRGCARGTGAWAQLATTSTGCFHRLGRVLRPRQASMCYRLQPKQSDRASVDDSRRRCTSAVMFFPRAGVAGDPTPVERGRA